MKKMLVACYDLPNVGYAFIQPSGDGTPGLFRDPTDGVFKPYDVKFITPLPTPMSPPNAERRDLIVPDKLPECLLQTYLLDPATSAPIKTLDIIGVAPDAVEVPHDHGRIVIVHMG